MKTMVYCFDLDGTLCYTNGTDYEGATPRIEVIDRVNSLYDAGHTIIIDTARGSGSKVNYTAMTHEQLVRWGVKYHEMRCGVKFPADEYVDDRGHNVEDWL